MQEPFDVFLALDEGTSLRLFPRAVLDDALGLSREAALTRAQLAIARELRRRDGLVGG